MVRYFVSTAAGDLSGLDASGISQKFNQMLSDAPMMILYMGIVIAAAVLVCSIGLKNGLERVTKVMMLDRKSTRLNSSHKTESRMPSSA